MIKSILAIAEVGFCCVGMRDLSDNYLRVVRFQETDAGGVVYFAELLGFCHEAYEDSLAKAGVDVRAFFSGSGLADEDGDQLAIAVPIVHAEADFFKPMFCGDHISISLMPARLTPNSFEVAYEVFSRDGQKVAKALTRHVAIWVDSRRRCPLPKYLMRWIADLVQSEVD